ncbi:response regulator FixJ [Caulifigura coniformis]|uniref:Response regulator FixJ n=1 Tax=Caulifigura coniformis TaxID=2527983 RepID=A0A517SMV0_9PLAN|nr:LuxR C-terminal-related transcriptional regulator [Caulifigura coniformis]QDT57453.1 response regulator FixJ [Caulifigura coniformis]
MHTSAPMRAIQLVQCDKDLEQAISGEIQERQLEVVTFESVDEFRRRFQTSPFRNDCILLESRSSSSLDLTSLIEVRRMAPAGAVILLTTNCSHANLMTALRCGATDVINGPVDAVTLFQRLDDYFESRPPKTFRIDRPQAIAGIASLTRCEREVLQLVLAAMTTQQISRSLHVGPQTVAKHKQQILRKLGVRNDVELVLEIVGNQTQTDHFSGLS